MKKLFNGLILIYQRLFSPFFANSCRFYPSCSHYFKGALERYSIWRALFLGFKRILRCHPYHPGGIDLP